MYRKRNNHNGDDGQFVLPFDKQDSTSKKNIQPDNIISFTTKLRANIDKVEYEARQRSIKRLLYSAEKLKW